MILCLRTVRIPADQRQRFLAWIDDNAELRRRHGILCELVLARSSRQNPAGMLQPDSHDEQLEHVVITAWQDHDFVRRLDRHPRSGPPHDVSHP